MRLPGSTLTSYWLHSYLWRLSPIDAVTACFNRAPTPLIYTTSRILLTAIHRLAALRPYIQKRPDECRSAPMQRETYCRPTSNHHHIKRLRHYDCVENSLCSSSLAAIYLLYTFALPSDVCVFFCSALFYLASLLSQLSNQRRLSPLIQIFRGQGQIMLIPSGVPLSKIPSLQPPPGVTPNFINPPSIANAIITVSRLFLVLMLAAVSMRIYTKGVIIRTLGWDDCKKIQSPKDVG